MEAIWQAVKNALKERLPGHSFNMWIAPLELSKLQSGIAVVCCPNAFSRKRVQDNYGTVLEKEISTAAGMPCRLMLEVSGKNSIAQKSKTQKIYEEKQLFLPNMDVHTSSGRLLRRDFRFENFVVGGSNDFAYSAALSIASGKTIDQNCLFLLSNTGLGKTHLSQAMGHHILSHYPHEKVFYITAEDFTNEMIIALKNNSIDVFKEKYRTQCDVLLMEDVHFLTGKERTQSELALALDYLLEAKKKLIFTSCYMPSEIPKMIEELKSRLSYGLVSNIDVPNFRTRVRILKKKALEKGFMIPGEILEYLAGELFDNVRQLESGLNGVVTKASLLNVPIDLDLAQSVVGNITVKGKSITIDTIKELVCQQYGISINDMMSRSRKQAIVKPRQVAIYLSRKYTDQPLQTIGKNFNRYHATIMHSINAVEKEVRQNQVAKKQINHICARLDSGKF